MAREKTRTCSRTRRQPFSSLFSGEISSRGTTSSKLIDCFIEHVLLDKKHSSRGTLGVGLWGECKTRSGISSGGPPPTKQESSFVRMRSPWQKLRGVVTPLEQR